MEAAEIGAKLREIGEYLALEGDLHRARAYRRAASSAELTPDLDRLAAEGALTTLTGVGDALAGVIDELRRRGSVGILERLRSRWPATVLELSRLPGVGPVKAQRLGEALLPRSLDDVARQCERGVVRALRGFGKVSEARILAAIRARDSKPAVLLLHEARARSTAFAVHLRGAPAVRRVEACGPARRWIEVVDRLAFAVETDEPEAVRQRLRGHPLVVSAVPTGEHSLLARLTSGLPCELHLAPAERFGVALITATGSAEHVAALRALAGEHGTRLDELRGADEGAVYAQLGLPLLPPEVRDGTDEVAAGLAGDPFDLVELADVTGAVHCHTRWSDGRNSVAEMAAAARARGLGFLTVTDHSASARYAHGLDLERLEQQRSEIEEAQASESIRILGGTESDILADGGLDYPLEALERLDVVIASIHKRHRLDEDGMTRRLVAAMRQPCFKIWGHPLGRLLLRREPVACRFEEVVDALYDSHAAIEINGDPHRLDLEPERARIAARRGAKFVLSSDAHSTSDLDHLEYAVAMARRARLRRRNVLNTLPPEEFARAVRPRRSRAD